MTASIDWSLFQTEEDLFSMHWTRKDPDSDWHLRIGFRLLAPCGQHVRYPPNTYSSGLEIPISGVDKYSMPDGTVCRKCRGIYLMLDYSIRNRRSKQ